ncbi:MAG: hypothetical protein Q4G39_03080, partial [Brachymonas sp.]|nr:hypothetical protein [Brachymonas sp.]
MNILYLNHYAGSPQHGMEYRPYYLAREWVRAGHSVRVVAADFSHVRATQPDLTALRASNAAGAGEFALTPALSRQREREQEAHGEMQLTSAESVGAHSDSLEDAAELPLPRAGEGGGEGRKARCQRAVEQTIDGI